MRSNFVYPTLSSIIAGLVLAAAGFYWFGPQPSDPFDGISIEARYVNVSNRLLTEIVRTSTGNLVGDKTELVKQFGSAFDYRNSFGILSYRVLNASKKTIEKLDVAFDSPILGYTVDELGQQTISKETKTASLKILPESSAEVVVLGEYVGWTLNERFMIDGQSVPVSKIDSARTNDYYLPEFYTKYASVIFFLSALGVLTLVVVALQLIQNLYVGNKPALLAKTTDTGTLARAVALVHWVRSDDPDTYKVVVRRAERIHQQWSRPDDPSQ